MQSSHHSSGCDIQLTANARVSCEQTPPCSTQMFVKVLFLRIGLDKYGILCKNVDMETTKSARTGHWALTKGGIMNYCSKSQHFTTDPVWNYWVGITSKMCVCDECAQKEEAA